MRREGFEPSRATRAGGVTARHNRPLCHLREVEDESGRMKDETRSCGNDARLHPSSFTLHPFRRSVTVEGFEPSTPCARGTCATKLRYTVITNRSRRESNPSFSG